MRKTRLERGDGGCVVTEAKTRLAWRQARWVVLKRGPYNAGDFVGAVKRAGRLRVFGFMYLWTLQRRDARFLLVVQRKADVSEAKKSEVLQGTLDLMILKTLHALGPQHGFGIARRIEQVSRDVLQLNEGTVYTSLLRLLQQRWIAAEWGTSENNRKAKFYAITARGEKQLEVETENWERISGVVGRVLRLEGER
jgi:transcriptional regulator